MSNNRTLDAGTRHPLLSFLSRSWHRLDAWFPHQYCLLCRAASGTALVCADCAAEMPPAAAEACPVCALPTPNQQLCGQCLSHPPHFDRTYSLWTYGFPLDTLIQSLKYGHQLAAARWLGEALAAKAPAVFANDLPDLLLPIPLSSGHLQERGFNQAVEIARPLARCLGLPLALDVCERVRETQAQTSLPWKLRQKNVRGAFECCQPLDGKHILVLDDVMTTGATLNELARTLKKHGARRVSNLVCARALKH